MSMTTMTSREFNQDASRAKKAARSGPVFITDRGRPAHVLLSIEDYLLLSSASQNIVDLLAMPAAAQIEFEPPRLHRITKPADLT
jgi:prevent-host-death family protein